MPSLSNTLDTYFSAARRVITIWSAIPWFDVPDAISSRASASRAVSRRSGSSVRRRCSRAVTIDGSIVEPPAATRRTDSTNVATSLIRSFSR